MYYNNNDLPAKIKKKLVFDIFLVSKILALICGKNAEFLE